MALLALLAHPSCRAALESTMRLQMLVQVPALLFSGALLAAAIPGRLRRCLAPWNCHGLAGLAAAAVLLGLLMIPRVLDLALTDARVDVVKMASLVIVGGVLGASWRRAGLVVQCFFLGNVLSMTFVVASLYRDAPGRLCNAYGLADQQLLGDALVLLCVVGAAVWLLGVALRLGDGSVASRAQP